MERPSKKLIDKWYKKLEKAGFKDIENKDGSLKAEIDPRTRSFALAEKELREAYFAAAKTFLQIHNFKDCEEKLIWELHALEGMGAVRIARQLKLTMYKADTTLAKLKRLAGLERKK